LQYVCVEHVLVLLKLIWFRGRVARQSSAKASTAVRIRSGPPPSPGNGGFCFNPSCMKKAHFIGSLACAAIVVLIFQPWVYIPSVKLWVSGWSAEGTDFGKPGLVPLVFSATMFFLFLLPAVWAKVTTIVLSTLQVAWMFRNYILLTTSFIGEMPEKQWALILLIPLTLLVLVMSLLSRSASIKTVKNGTKFNQLR
jgi:hypothetical protein